MIMGTRMIYNIGDKTQTSGPNGAIVDGIRPCMILRKATFEEWQIQSKKKQLFSDEYYKNCNFYEVSVD